MTRTRTRTIVVWCPDWPAVAAARQANRPAGDPVAVLHANRVRACTAAARAEGVHVGQRRRDAQARCPDLLITGVDQDRDARMFEPVAAAVEALAPGVEVLRCGVVACPARGPARYFGSEDAAAERIVDAVEALDVECRIGIADDLEVAVLAAHRSAIVASGGSADVLRGTADHRPVPGSGDLPVRPGRADRPVDPAGHQHRRGVRRAPAGQGGHPVRRRRGAGAPARPRPSGTRPVPTADPGGTVRRAGVRPAAGSGGHRRVRRPRAGASGSMPGSPTPAWPAPGWPSPPPPNGATPCPEPGGAPRR